MGLTINADGTFEGLPGLINETGMSDEDLEQFLLEHMDEIKEGLASGKLQEMITESFVDSAEGSILSLEAFISDIDFREPIYMSSIVYCAILSFIGWKTRSNLIIQGIICVILTAFIFCIPELNEAVYDYFCSSTEAISEVVTESITESAEEPMCFFDGPKSLFIPVMIGFPSGIAAIVILLNIIVRGIYRCCTKKSTTLSAPVATDDATSATTDVVDQKKADVSESNEPAYKNPFLKKNE